MKQILMALVLLFALRGPVVATLCAAETTVVAATVVALEKGRLIVRTGNLQETIELRGVKTVDANGRVLTGRSFFEAMKKGTRLELVKEDEKVVEIRVRR